jgi:hypothetical protein
MKNSLRTALVLCGLIATLSACKAKIESEQPAPPAPPPVKPFTHDISGPSLDGTWKSGCVRDVWGNGYKVFDIVIKNQDTVRTETKYVDINCSQKIDTTIADGWFRFTKNLGQDIYEVEYKFKMPNGHYYTGDNVRRIGAQLFISDRHVGPAVVPDIQLNLVLAP